MKFHRLFNRKIRTASGRLAGFTLLIWCVVLTGCVAPIGADKTTPALAYRQTHENPVGHGQPSPQTRTVLHRFEQVERFEKSPDDVLQKILQKAVETRDRDLLFALSELNYLAAEKLRHSVKKWEERDARDYYLASALFAWLFLFGDGSAELPNVFDERAQTSCDLYNYGLSWALIEDRSTNARVSLQGGSRRLPNGPLEIEFKAVDFPWPLTDFDHFAAANHFTVRGLSVRNRQAGLGAPLVAATKEGKARGLPRSVPATMLLRFEGGLTALARGGRATLELYSPFNGSTVRVGGRTVPLETDTTVSMAYTLNQSFVWKLGMAQFLSSQEQIRSDVYLTQPYRPGRIPVVFVHGTFSSPVWWAEMVNTLAADPILRQRYQFWYFIYNSGNPIVHSAQKLRGSLEAKVRELDPNGRDGALQQMVVIGHSQGGLLTKLTATDTGDRLLQAVLKTNRLEDLEISAAEQAAVRRYICFEALPFVKRVIFVCTPHRGSYLAGGLARKLARRFVTLPAKMVKRTTDLAGLTEKLDLPKELRGTPTSLDSMSPNNPVMHALADIPLAPGIKGHSIIAVQGDGDYHLGRDGLVTYESAHVGYAESEFIVRGYHSCQQMPATIEEVRRILHEHAGTVPAKNTAGK
jgi:pimeloyl-ACP methyl ester carboxylesterase